MLLSFSFNNYLSYNNTTYFSTCANRELFTGKLNEVNNVVVVSGQSASGKSNWVRALLFVSNMVLHSHKHEQLLSETLHPFLLKEAKSFFSDSTFEVDMLLSGKHYRYGFTLSHSGMVNKEWLYIIRGKIAKTLFTRNNKEIAWPRAGQHIKNKLVSDDIRSDCLLLSSYSRQGFKPATTISHFFSNQLLIIAATAESDYTDWETAKKLFTVPGYKRFVLYLLQNIDASIDNIALAKVSGGGSIGQGEFNDKQSRVFNRNSILVLKSAEDNQNAESDFIVIKRYLPNTRQAVYFNAAFEEGATIRHIITYGFLLAHALLKGATVVMDMPELAWGKSFTRKLAKLFIHKAAFAPERQFIFTASAQTLRNVPHWHIQKNERGESEIKFLKT